jgi:predicted acyltransferase
MANIAPASDATTILSSPARSSAKRLGSLDILRGVTIAFMIMVNNNGGEQAWAQMHHAVWNGFTATDLVFPTFLFAVGVSIVFATEARLRRGETREQLALHAVKRACVLFAFGVVVNSFPRFHLDHMRFYGVLQRIAVCYLVVQLFYLWDKRLSTKIAALMAVLLGYWALVSWIPIPGAGMPGHDVPFLDTDQNIVAWLDRHLMPGHLYEDKLTHNIRDPEGLLSDIPALGTTLLGLLAGFGLCGNKAPRSKAGGLLASALVCLALGYTWSIWFPLNKKMWTSTFVLVAGGWSLLLFALFYWAIEIRGWCRQGAAKALAWPWLVFGSNAIAAYMISELLPGTLNLIHFKVGGSDMTPLHWWERFLAALIANPGWAAFSYSVTYTLVCFIPVWLLYRNKLFLKV